MATRDLVMDLARGCLLPSSGCRPAPDQEILLDAILLSGEEAIGAWRTWRAQTDIERLDPATFQVMPLLYWNLSQQGISDDLVMARLKGIYRMAWSRNQWLASRALPALRALHGRGIPMALLKGAALNALYGEQHGIRLISDVDLLVPRGDAQRAADTLGKLGWAAKGGRIRVTETFISVSKGLNLVESGGGQLDLHWHLFPEDFVESHEDPVWQYARPLLAAEVPVLVPSPTELLLHVCVHGWAWTSHPPFRWVADAMTILGTSGMDIDWARLVEEARRRRLVLRLGAALSYLRVRFQAKVPDGVIEGLREAPVSRWDRLEYRLRTRPMRTPIGGLVLHALRFRRLPDESGLRPGLLGFFEYLRRQWGLRHAGQVPFWMGAKLAGRLGRSLGRAIGTGSAGLPRIRRGARADRR